MQRYDEAESRWLLPVFMRADAFDSALAEVVDSFGADASNSMELYPIWESIGIMPESDLDALAADMAIPFYHAGFPLEKKRSIVPRARLMQAKLGTPWAVASALDLYYTNPTKVVEWFDYDDGPGLPGHFMIQMPWSQEMHEESKQIRAVITSVKRAGAILDGIYATIDQGTPPLRAGCLCEDRCTLATEARIDRKTYEWSSSCSAVAAVGTQDAAEFSVSARIHMKEY